MSFLTVLILVCLFKYLITNNAKFYYFICYILKLNKLIGSLTKTNKINVYELYSTDSLTKKKKKKRVENNKKVIIKIIIIIIKIMLC